MGVIAQEHFEKLRDYEMRQRDLNWEVFVDREKKKPILWDIEKYFWETEGKSTFMQWEDGFEKGV